MALATSASAGFAASPQALPYDTEWGTNTASSCGAAWATDCDTDWEGFGDTGSLRLKQPIDLSSVALFIQPSSGSSSSNGVTKTFAVPASGGFRLDADVRVMGKCDESANVKVGVQWFDSSDTLIQTDEWEQTVSGYHAVNMPLVAPSSASYFQLSIGANGRSAGWDASDNAVVLNWRRLIGIDIWTALCNIARRVCEENEPDISCPDPYIPTCTCHVDDCVALQTCYCADPLEMTCPVELEFAGWTDI